MQAILVTEYDLGISLLSFFFGRAEHRLGEEKKIEQRVYQLCCRAPVPTWDMLTGRESRATEMR